MQLLGLVLVGVCSVLGVVALGAGVPGKLVIWSNTRAMSGSNVQYNTATVTPQRAAEHVHRLTDSNEHIVLLTPKESSGHGVLFEKVANAVKSAETATVLSNVLRQADETDKSIRDHISSSGLKFSSMSLEDLVVKLGSEEQLSHRATEVSVDVADQTHTSLLERLFSLSGKKMVFVALNEPDIDAVAPTEHANYRRLLSSSASTTSAPVGGGEFSIYYEGTYLYITPDLFTGIMTALFMVAVALTGFSCMGSIQGMSTFYDKIPSNGKEA